jgi:hypothetical protein
MLPETFESRERIGASACGKKPWDEEVSLKLQFHLAHQPDEGAEEAETQIVGTGGPWIASIAYRTTQDPRSKDRPSFSSFNGQTQSGRGNGKADF